MSLWACDNSGGVPVVSGVSTAGVAVADESVIVVDRERNAFGRGRSMIMWLPMFRAASGHSD